MEYYKGLSGDLMGAKKTIDDYIQGIREKHSMLKAYPTSKKLQLEYPEIASLKNKLDTQVRGWIKNLDITIFVAQNEKLDWKPDEFYTGSPSDLKLNFRPMLLKSKSGYDQVGDYQAYYSGGGVSGWIPILAERKGGVKNREEDKTGSEDLYGSLMDQERCERLYNEIIRFNADDRFTQMIIITECTLSQFLLYTPLFNGKSRNINHIGASPESRGGKIDSLFIRGVPVLFAGTRTLAIKRYKGLLKAWLRLNYASILKLDVEPYNDLVYLKTKKARLEAELHAVNVDLLSYAEMIA